MERLGYINQSSEKDMALAKDLTRLVEKEFNKRNVFVLLCQIERIWHPWMLGTEEKGG